MDQENVATTAAILFNGYVASYRESNLLSPSTQQCYYECQEVPLLKQSKALTDKKTENHKRE